MQENEQECSLSLRKIEELRSSTIDGSRSSLDRGVFAICCTV